MRQILSVLLLVVFLGLNGCGHSHTSSAETVNRTYKLSDATSSGGPKEPEAVSLPTSPLLYHPDSTGQYLVSRELSDLSLSDPTLDVKLVEALVDSGILQKDVTLNSISFDLTEDKKQEIVLLDFNDALQRQFSGCEAEQERMLMGSLVDTFLSAYDRDLAIVTVEGNRLVSPNDYVYRNAVPWYECCDTTPFTKTVRQDDVRLKLSLARMYSDAGFLIEQDTETFTYRYDSATHTASFHAPDTRHRDEIPAFLTIAPSAQSQTQTLAQARQKLKGTVTESTQKIGVNQVDAVCLTASDQLSNTTYCVFSDDGRVWLAQVYWNPGEEQTRLARMEYMLSTFQAIS